MFSKRIVLILFFILFFISPKQNFNYISAENDPGSFVMEMTTNAINTLTDKSISQNDIENQFGILFRNVQK